MPISEHAFTIAAIQAFYLVKHQTQDLLFGDAKEDAKKKKSHRKKNDSWKKLKAGQEKKDDVIDSLKTGVHEKIRFNCCDNIVLFLTQVVFSCFTDEDTGRFCGAFTCCRIKRVDAINKIYNEG